MAESISSDAGKPDTKAAESCLPALLFTHAPDKRYQAAQVFAAALVPDAAFALLLRAVEECVSLLTAEEWIQRQGAVEALAHLGPVLRVAFAKRRTSGDSQIRGESDQALQLLRKMLDVLCQRISRRPENERYMHGSLVETVEPGVTVCEQIVHTLGRIEIANDAVIAAVAGVPRRSEYLVSLAREALGILQKIRNRK